MQSIRSCNMENPLDSQCSLVFGLFSKFGIFGNFRKLIRVEHNFKLSMKIHPHRICLSSRHFGGFEMVFHLTKYSKNAIHMLYHRLIDKQNYYYLRFERMCYLNALLDLTWFRHFRLKLLWVGNSIENMCFNGNWSWNFLCSCR